MMVKTRLLICASLALLPMGLRAASADLTWDPATGDNLAGYKVYYGTARRANACPTSDYDHVIDVGNTTSHTLTGLLSDERYFFAVTAYDLNGNESCFSNEASKFTGALAERAVYIELDTRAFSPDDANPERKSAILNFNVGQASALKTILVYDVRGQRVRTLMDNDQMSNGGGNYAGQAQGSVDWDGKDDSGTPLPVGIYVVTLRAEDPSTGFKQMSRDTVAIGRTF